MRITKDEYYLSLAEVVATRATCLHRQYGAVIVKDDRIIATGYNGAPRGEANCCDRGVCPRDTCPPPEGDKYSACVAVHAEQNALICAANAQGATLYLATTDEHTDPKPCYICNRMIQNAGLSAVITKRGVIWSRQQ